MLARVREDPDEGAEGSWKCGSIPLWDPMQREERRPRMPDRRCKRARKDGYFSFNGAATTLPSFLKRNGFAATPLNHIPARKLRKAPGNCGAATNSFCYIREKSSLANEGLQADDWAHFCRFTASFVFLIVKKITTAVTFI
jgi:hypothetical protein